MNRSFYCIEAIERRLLLSRIDIERVLGVLGALYEGTVFVPFGPGDQTINGSADDDSIFVHASDDRNITINPQDGSDFVEIAADGDFDAIGTGTIIVNPGTDQNQDEFIVDDAGDTGNDTYNLSESSGLISVSKTGSNGFVRFGQPHVLLALQLNRGNDTVNLDSTVSVNNTGQILGIEQQTQQNNGGGTHNTVVNFDGTINSGGELNFNGSTGTSTNFNTFNLNGNIFSGNGSVNFGGDGDDFLNITDTGATDTYNIKLSSIQLVHGTTSGAIGFSAGIDTLLNSANGLGSHFNIDLGTVSTNQFFTPLTIQTGDGSDVISVGTNVLAPLHSSLNLDGGSGFDSVVFNDPLDTDDLEQFQLQNNQFSSTLSFFPTVPLAGIESFRFVGGPSDDFCDIGSGNTAFTAIEFDGNAGQDSFNVTPSTTANVICSGGANVSNQGDELFLTGNGARRGELDVTGTGQGNYTFSNRDRIDFSGFENFSQPPTNNPSAPDLASVDDTGRSSTDNVTNRITPTFNGTGPASSEIVLYREDVESASATSTSGGAWSIVSGAFPNADATYSMTARWQDTSTGLLSVAGPLLNVRVDTRVPLASPAPDLADASDTGNSNTDNITRDTTPTFNGTVETNAIVRLFNGTSQVGSVTLALLASAYSVTSSTLTDGVKSMTVTQEDLAGNVSAPSAALSVTIDTIAPSAPAAAPDLDAASDSGASPTDNITNDNTPSMSGSVPANLIVRLFNGTAEVGFDSATSTGAYTIVSSTLADGVRPMSTRFEDLAGNLSASGPALNVTIDTVAPQFTSGGMTFTPTSVLSYTFNEPLAPSSVTTNDLVLHNQTDNTLVPAAAMSVSTNAATATFTFPGLPAGLLADGSYLGTIAATRVTDVAGNVNATSAAYQFIWSAGSASSDHYTIDVSADGQSIEVYENSATPSFVAPRASLDALGISAGAGNDRFLVDLAHGSPVPADGMSLDGGTETDSLGVSGSPAAEFVTFAVNTVNIGNARIVRWNLESLDFDGKGGFDTLAITGGLPVAMAGPQHLQSLLVSGGASATVFQGGSNLIFTRALAIASGSTLDLNDNDLLLDYTGASQLAAVQSLINSARAAGAWTGTGLTSGFARTNPAHNTTLGAMEATDYAIAHGGPFDGETPDATAVLVKYTYYGDADFNGKVNFDDYVRTDNGFNNHMTGWTNGDFDGNGAVNFDDYVLIDLAFNTQNGTLGRRLQT
jgi:hypothetical protein